MRLIERAEFDSISVTYDGIGLVFSLADGTTVSLTREDSVAFTGWLDGIFSAPLTIPNSTMPSLPLVYTNLPPIEPGRISDAESVRNRPSLEQMLKANGAEVLDTPVNIPVEVNKK